MLRKLCTLRMFPPLCNITFVNVITLKTSLQSVTARNALKGKIVALHFEIIREETSAAVLK